MSRARRPHRTQSAILRWIGAVLPVLLVVGLLARGHALQALGVAVACEHPMLASPSADEALHDDGAQDSDDGAQDGPHRDCPPNCDDCACGRIPMTLPLGEVLPYLLVEAYEIAAATPPERPGRSPTYRVERPPRRARA